MTNEVTFTGRVEEIGNCKLGRNSRVESKSGQRGPPHLDYVEISGHRI